jgi:oligopeptide/dipeptide ABC transporter ATP-binding protein
METGSVEAVFERPMHPYTQGLLSSVTSLHGASAARHVELRNELELSDVLNGCPLAPRCPLALEPCRTDLQELVEYEAGHRAACWRVPEVGSVASAPRRDPVPS